jgi:hypothetical protein
MLFYSILFFDVYITVGGAVLQRGMFTTLFHLMAEEQ